MDDDNPRVPANDSDFEQLPRPARADMEFETLVEFPERDRIAKHVGGITAIDPVASRARREVKTILKVIFQGEAASR